ncbi:hypothetical protein A2U01_0000655 [Trifolium medium]|uniref:Uncharacterized protein n=1 Tax=Trifolium medium TaxID=97028 RepID=A0A392M003_9FABA|nr:hypothetical protein [Trifolium medium]
MAFDYCCWIQSTVAIETAYVFVIDTSDAIVVVREALFPTLLAFDIFINKEFRSSISFYVASSAFPSPLNGDWSYAGDEKEDEQCGVTGFCEFVSRKLSSQNPRVYKTLCRGPSPRFNLCEIAEIEFAEDSMFYMADFAKEPVEGHRLVDTVTDPELAWVRPEPRGIASVIKPTAGGMHTEIEDVQPGEPDDWDICPSASHCVCSEFSDDEFAMYEFAFSDLGF